MPGEIELIVSRQALTHRFLVRVGLCMNLFSSNNVKKLLHELYIKTLTVWGLL